MKRTLLTLGLVLGFMSGGLAYGDYISLVNINFYYDQAKIGAAAVGSAGDQWNDIPAGRTGWTSDLKDAGGNTTTVDFSKDTSAYYRSQGSPQDALFRGYTQAATDGGSGNFSIAGLDAGKTYDLYLYSDWSWDNHASYFTIGGVTKQPNEGTNYLNSFVEGENYVVFRGLTGADHYVCNYGHATGKAPFSGLQLAQVPEPATLSLLVLGGLAGMRKFRK